MQDMSKKCKPMTFLTIEFLVEMRINQISNKIVNQPIITQNWKPITFCPKMWTNQFLTSKQIVKQPIEIYKCEPINN